MKQRIVALWLAYVLLVVLTMFNWTRTENLLHEIEDQNCALAGLELIATEYLLLPKTPTDDELERRAAIVVARLSKLCDNIEP